MPRSKVKLFAAMRCDSPFLPLGETTKPRPVAWAFVESRLTESNRRPTHYESQPHS
jgi:hypothetical protein